jgi:hypothetical protein
LNFCTPNSIQFTRRIDKNISKRDFVVHFVMQEGLDDFTELLANLGDNLAQLTAWDKWQYFEPNLDCEVTAKKCVMSLDGKLARF